MPRPEYPSAGRIARPVAGRAVSCYARSMDNATSVVAVDPEIMGGKPCFAGTRVPVTVLFDALARGRSVDYFVEQFPTVKAEQVRAVLAQAEQLVRSDALANALVAAA